MKAHTYKTGHKSRRPTTIVDCLIEIAGELDFVLAQNKRVQDKLEALIANVDRATQPESKPDDK